MALSRDVLAGGCTVAVVTGEPGIGKSRLVQRAVELAGLPHRFLVRGHEVEHDIPLSAAAELLRRAGRAAPPGSLLADLRTGEGSRAEEFAPLRVFEAVHQFLRTRQPAHLLIDDLHWIDEQSRVLCHYLVRAAVASGGRLAVIVTTRRHVPVASGLADLVATGRRAELELGPLARAEGLALLRALAPDLPEHRAERYYERSGGTPFWLARLATAASDDPAPADLLGGTLRGCDEGELEVLAGLAVIGRPAPRDELAALLGTPLQATGTLVASLRRRGLVTVSAGRVAIAHDLIREAVLAVVPEESRRGLHRRAAEAIPDADGDVAHLLAALRHRRAAGMPVLEVATRIAHSPHRRLVGREGLDDLGEIADTADPDDPRTLELGRGVATLAAGLGDYDQSLLRWAVLADRLPEPRARGWAALSAAKAAYELRMSEAALAYLEQARGLAGRDVALTIAVDARESAVRRWLEHRHEDGRALAERATTAARAVPVERLDPAARRAYAGALRALYDGALFEDDAEGMLDIARELVALTRGANDRSFVSGLLFESIALRFLGRPRQAEVHLRVVLKEAHRRALPGTRAQAAYWLARTLHDQARLHEAREVLEQAAALVRRLGRISPVWPRIERQRAWIELSCGDWPAALEAMTRVADTEDDPHFRLDAQHVIATWLSRVGGEDRAEEVARRVEDALGDAETAACRRCQRVVSLLGAVALARVGRGGGAEKLLRRASDGGPDPDPEAALWRDHARALLTGDDATAAAALAEAARTAAEAGLGLEELWLHLDRARRLAPDDPEAAVTVLRMVRERAQQAGAVTESGVAEEALRRLGVRIRTRDVAPTGEAIRHRLTDRERQVADLVATGASNPEIAAALFLSRRTVERHVSNILAKAGVRNRTELARLLTEVGGAHP